MLKTYNVPDVSCGHCKASIEDALSGRPGITNASVDVHAKTVDVAFDPSVVSENEVLAKLEEAGYPAS